MSKIDARTRTLSRHSPQRTWRHILAALTFLLVAAATSPAALACACGCGVFDIANLFQTETGGSVFLEYDYMDQNKNWSGLSQAPADANDDKSIRTSFYTAGLRYLFASGFGVMVELPYWQRHFATDTGSTIERFDHGAFGDLRLTGVYSGFSEHNETAITLGIKLPTGDDRYAGFDRDTEIGSGSTDLALGAYHLGKLSSDGVWRYFVQGRYQFALSSTADYRPGNELNGVAGVTYDAGLVADTVALAPTLQLIASIRDSDKGAGANPADSGYSRLLVSPGVDIILQRWTLHTEVDFPLYQNIIGNQLIAQELIKTTMSYSF